MDLHSRRLEDSCGLTGPQLAVLREAERLGPVSAGALARAVHLSQPTVTGILTRLEKRGLLARERGETDRRTVTVRLTEAGRDVISSAPSLLQDRFRRELGRLEEWERLMTLTVLQRVAGMMGAESLDAAPHLASGAALHAAERPGPPPERGARRPTRQPPAAPRAATDPRS